MHNFGFLVLELGEPLNLFITAAVFGIFAIPKQSDDPHLIIKTSNMTQTIQTY